METVKVWDPLVRIVHWSLVVLVLGNLLNEDGSQLHRYMGYAAVALVVLRVLWGWIGSRHARFDDWFPWPSRLLPYLKALLAGHPPRHLGHNPAGAAMMLTLLALIVALGVTGWMMDLDAFWGEEWLENVHETLADVLLGCVAMHVLAALAMSWWHGENLPAGMIHGRKQSLSAPTEDEGTGNARVAGRGRSDSGGWAP
ncbi:cytochrome b/b6 domain-containing protein [Chitiniphilus purpureus]|uniref:Cytochrome b/b6 domain-containing protein n=1 Tax=Chitiniphilus purpureus TaxID=2981137 RepID=A0ABY6DNI3_9NEIS|nr:cytochrome b/b6 domain-containing protein [Chitiniphilus sp. CD1]UXY15929.1 cytochrome b/b6 domain-containing protein [Chitiniphilus sp. CD1]